MTSMKAGLYVCMYVYMYICLYVCKFLTQERRAVKSPVAENTDTESIGVPKQKIDCILPTMTSYT